MALIYCVLLLLLYRIDKPYAAFKICLMETVKASLDQHSIRNLADSVLLHPMKHLSTSCMKT